MLTYLLQNGLTEEDIVNINTICLSNIKKIKSNSKADIKQNTDKSECWSMFTKELKKYGDITLVTREKSKKLEEMVKEICSLEKQKQELTIYCKNAKLVINNLNNKISYLNGSINYLNNGISDKIKAFPRLPPLFIFFINNDTEEKEKGEKGGT